MKSILIIGMGRFGRHLCQNLAELGNQIMIVDQEEENLEEMLPLVVSAKIGDYSTKSSRELIFMVCKLFSLFLGSIFV